MVLEMSVAANNPGPLLGRVAETGLLVSLLDGIGTGGDQYSPVPHLSKARDHEPR
jgi:hypothetical protein